MLDSFLTDFTDIRDTLSKEGDHTFFGKDFSFFSAEPILFYNNEKDVIVYANSMFSKEFNYSIEDLKDWKYSIYPLLNMEDQEPFRNAMNLLLNGDENTLFPDATYRLVNKGKKYSYYRVKIRKLQKSYYYIQLENSVKAAIPVLKNKTADDLMNNAESILKFGFWLWDYATDRLYWTKGMYQLLEYDMDEEVIASITPDFYISHILKNDAYLEFEKRLKDGNVKDSYRNKLQLRSNKGKLLTVFEHATIEYDDAGKIKRITGLTRDITTQEESMKSLADYKAMIQENETFLNYGTWESDADGTNILWSDGMYNIFGYDEADKKSLKINKGLYTHHMDGEGDEYSRSMKMNMEEAQKKDYYQWDYQLTDYKGVIKILSTYGKIIRNNEKEIQKIIGTTRDVTELKRYEITLENKISALNRSNRELEEFAYVASHDLQEPLRKISTFSQRLQLKFSDSLGDDGLLYINRIVASCENMRKLIDNLLEFSRLSISNHTLEQVDFGVSVVKAMEELDLIIAETNTVVKISQLPVIEAIDSQILQLFVNLLSNSIKFRKETVSLQIDISARKLSKKEKEEYQLSTDLAYFMIQIEDNGIGFEQQYADKIFQLFQRLEGKSEYPGTGIGLSICKKIVNNHNGIIFANGVPEEGATITIILPARQKML
jgi:PAS domain S-box-containing protein